MKSIPLTLALALAALSGNAVAARAQTFEHATFDTLLALYVQDSRVDYTALKIGREILDRYVDQLAGVDADEFAGWAEAEQIAYLINAYNAYVLETVIDNYPIEGSGFFKKLTAPRRFSFPENSIRHIDGVFDRILHRVAGQQHDLCCWVPLPQRLEQSLSPHLGHHCVAQHQRNLACMLLENL